MFCNFLKPILNILCIHTYLFVFRIIRKNYKSKIKNYNNKILNINHSIKANERYIIYIYNIETYIILYHNI